MRGNLFSAPRRMLLSRRGRWLVGVVALALYGLVVVGDPQTTYKVFSYRRPVTDGVTFAGWNLWSVIVMAAGLAVTSTLGSSLTRLALADVPVDAMSRHVAGYAVGYTAMCAIVRLATLVMPVGSIFSPTILVAASIIGFAWLRPRTSSHFGDWTTVIRAAGVWLVLLAVLLCSQVYMNDFRWVGHGPMQYAFFIADLHHSGLPEYFPIIPQHVDESLFALFLTDLMPAACEPIVAMWINLALVKVSTTALVYCLLLKSGAARSWAALGAGFLLFGTTAINPLKYIALFDSFSPIAYTVHAGRIIGITLTLLIVTDLLAADMDAGDRGQRRQGMTHMTYALVGAGLACSSLSNLALLAFVLATTWATRIRGECLSVSRCLPTRIERLGAATLLMLSLVSCPLAYGLAASPGMKPWHGMGTGQVLVTSIVGFLVWIAMAAGAALWAVMRAPRSLLAPWTTKPAMLLLAGGAMCLFVVNVPCDNPMSRSLVGFLNGFSWFSDLRITNPFASPWIGRPERPLLFVDSREIGAWTQYNADAAHFLGAYALIFVAAVVAHALLTPRPDRPADTQAYGWLWVNCMAIGIMPLLFFFADFVFDGNRSWVKTRFLEIPVYCVLFAFFLACSGIKSLRHRRYVMLVTSLYIVLPVLGTHRLAQWLDNAKLLWRMMGPPTS